MTADLLPLLLLLWNAAGLMIAAAPSPAPAPDCASLQSLLSPCVAYIQDKRLDQPPTDECCSGVENVVSINSTCACDLYSMSLTSGTDRYNATLRMLDLPKLCSVVEFDPSTTCKIQALSTPPPPSLNTAPGADSSSSSSSFGSSASAARHRWVRILFLFLTAGFVTLSC